MELVAVVDDRNIGEKFLGNIVKDPASLRALSFDRILITAVESRQDVMNRVLAQGVSPRKMVVLE